MSDGSADNGGADDRGSDGSTNDGSSVGGADNGSSVGGADNGGEKTIELVTPVGQDLNDIAGVGGRVQLRPDLYSWSINVKAIELLIPVGKHRGVKDSGSKYTCSKSGVPRRCSTYSGANTVALSTVAPFADALTTNVPVRWLQVQ